jgi:hypothetical protein
MQSFEPSAQPITLTIQPGFFSETGDRDAVGRWKTGDRVRFKNGLPEKMGGWEEATITGSTLEGIDRREHEWTSLDGQPWIAQGTSRKLYLINRGIRYDITPVRRTITLTDLFTTDGTTTVTVLDVLHGAETGDFVRFSGATAVGGQTIDGEYEITVLNGNQYTITIPVAATAATGGGAVVTEYDINVGLDSAEQAHGWGTCTYGTGTYGTRRGDCSAIILGPRIWSLDNFGEDLLASPRGGALYWWDRSLGPTTRAVLVETAPPTIERMLVSPSGDQVIALGAFDSVAGTPDKMFIKASAIGTFADWDVPIDPEEDTTVFEERITNGSRIIGGFKTSGGVLVQTDKATYFMRPDPSEIYAIDQVATENTLCGPNAGIDVNGVGFWMALDKIMAFDGVQQELPCDVWGFVFDNEAAAEGKSPGFNRDQADKVYSYYNKRGDEVTWLYPSLESDENDRYLCFNRTQRIWYYGSIARTAMSTGGIAYSLPYGSAPTGELFLHEGVPDADGALMNEFIESWDMQIGAGRDATHLSMYVPDFKRWTGTMRMQLKVKDRPQQTTYVTSTYDMEDDTIEQGVHDCGRAIAVRFGSIELGASWRMAPGTFYGQPDAAG